MADANKKKKRLIVAISLCVFSLIAGFIIGAEVAVLSAPKSVYVSSEYDKLKSILTENWYSEIYYGKDIDEEVLIDQFVGAISTSDARLLDGYTYLEDNGETTTTTGVVKGKLGMTLTNYYNYPVVSDVLEIGAAYNIMKPGDIVYAIKGYNGQLYTIASGNYSFSTLFSSALGVPGSDVTLYYYRLNSNTNKLEAKESTITLKQPNSYQRYVKEYESGISDTLMVQVSGFTNGTDGTCDQLKKILSTSNANNLIIDLIDNGGGSLDCCVDVCSLFIDNNLLITSLENKKGQKTNYYSENDGNYYSYDTITIFQNGNTASASEILISTLSYYYPDSVTLVGSKSYGKGIASTSVSVLDGRYTLHYTVAKWLRPDGSWIGMNGSKFTTNEGYQLGFDVKPAYQVTPSNTYSKFLNYYSYLYYANVANYYSFTIDNVSTNNMVFFEIYNSMYNTNIRVDGYFDESCKDEIKNYQKLKGLSESGNMDEITYINFVFDSYLVVQANTTAHINVAKGIING